MSILTAIQSHCSSDLKRQQLSSKKINSVERLPHFSHIKFKDVWQFNRIWLLLPSKLLSLSKCAIVKFLSFLSADARHRRLVFLTKPHFSTSQKKFLLFYCCSSLRIVLSVLRPCLQVQMDNNTVLRHDPLSRVSVNKEEQLKSTTATKKMHCLVEGQIFTKINTP